jgi:F-box-like
VKDITDRLKTAQEECRRLEREWHSYSSTLSPIRACPLEILSMIFRLYLAENPRRVRRLLLVCRQWHEVAIKDPQLWNRICIKVDEKVWDLKSVCDSYKKHARMCLQRSGAALLDIKIDCDELCSSRNQILEMIKEPFAGLFMDEDMDAEVAFLNWLYNLELDELDIPAVTTTCQPKYIISTIKLIAGKRGENMGRWGSLDLTLPRASDPEIVASVWELFKGPAPCLNRLNIRTQGLSRIDDSDLDGSFPDLLTLKHLRIDSVQAFRSLTLNPPSIESLVIDGDISNWPAYDLSQFTHLQDLEAYVYSSDAINVAIEVSLPLLKRLTLSGYFCGPNEIRFNTPILQDVNILARSPYDISKKPDFLPDLQSLRVSWTGSDYSRDRWQDGKLQTEMKTILAHFHKAKELTVSKFAKKALVETLHLLHNCGGLSDELETVGFTSRRGNIIETIDVRTLLMPNSS